MRQDPAGADEDGGQPPRIEPFGDAALLVTFSDVLDLRANQRALALAAAIPSWKDRSPDEAAPFRRPVVAHASVLVPYDCEVVDATVAVDRLRRLVTTEPGELASGSADAGTTDGDLVVEIPVTYGGRDGPDLAEVAARHGLAENDVVRLHGAQAYRVLLLGFAPGFAYLGLLPPELDTPRRATPRPRVPAGSVAIAGRQTAVYPLATPGGWQLIGRTSVRLWDPLRDPPNLLSPGQRVRFRPA